MVGPNFRNRENELRSLVDERVQLTLEKRELDLKEKERELEVKKKELELKEKEIANKEREKETGESGTIPLTSSPGTKLDKMIQDIKKRKGITTLVPDTSISTSSGFTPSGIGISGISCPNCHSHGHEHTLEPDKSGLIYKCTGSECGTEYVLASKNAQHKCTTCGLPIEDVTTKDAPCPFCNGKRAVKFDWSIITKRR